LLLIGSRRPRLGALDGRCHHALDDGSAATAGWPRRRSASYPSVDLRINALV